MVEDCESKTYWQKYYEAHREKRREYSRQYYQTHKEKKIEYSRQYYQTHKEKCRERHNEYGQKYRQIHGEKLSEYARKRLEQVRWKIINLLGNKCVKCGFPDLRALQIDHVHGGGRREWREFNGCMKYFRHILEKIKDGSKDYQLLCANCNLIKKYENHEVRRKHEGVDKHE